MSYSNYSTYLKYKNCCKPIGDTGPPGPQGPTVPGSKGEIIYFSNDDNLVSTDSIFIASNLITINNNLAITNNLSLSDNFINDVSGIYFSDNTFIGHGSSFDITTSQKLDISASAGINISASAGINIYSATTLNNKLSLGTEGNIRDIKYLHFIDEIMISSSSGSSGSNPSIHIDASSTILTGNIDFIGNNYINNCAGIYFPDGNYIDYQQGVSQILVTGNSTFVNDVQMHSGVIINGTLSVGKLKEVESIELFNGINNPPTTIQANIFTANNNIYLPSANNEPISLERKTLYYNSSYNQSVSGSPIDFSFNTPVFNQMKLTLGTGNTTIIPSLDISGQYVELYADLLINSTNPTTKTISLDISGINITSSFKESIDVRTFSKKGEYYITFGPHIFIPKQWTDTKEFVITANTTDYFEIKEYKFMFKSYYL
jgi:hypothetical protein